jgi:thioesterase domain-containing protein
LGLDQPVYGLQLQGMDGELDFHDRIEDMAAHYLTEICTAQPQGPYLIGGRCFGSLVALEMAQQLQARGQEVALLALIDPIVPPAFKSFRYRVKYCMKNLPHNPGGLLTHLRGLSTRWGTRKSKKMLGYLLRHLYRLYPATVFEEVSQELLRALPQAYAWRKHISRARRSYIPQVYPGRITCFVDHERAGLLPYPWTELAVGGVEWLQVPGHQESMFQEPHVQGLAEKLQRCLAATWPSPRNGGRGNGEGKRLMSEVEQRTADDKRSHVNGAAQQPGE